MNKFVVDDNINEMYLNLEILHQAVFRLIGEGRNHHKLIIALPPEKSSHFFSSHSLKKHLNYIHSSATEIF
jgi:hypothetical protein